MKKAFCAILLAALAVCLCACGAEAPRKTTAAATIGCTFRNEIGSADVWIIPNTEANRKTTVWGAATIAKAAADTDCRADIAISESGEYLLRMIDERQMYYESKAFLLSAGGAITIRADGDAVLMTVADASGGTVYTGEVFCAAL